MKARRDNVMSYVNRAERRRSASEAAGSKSRSLLDLSIVTAALGTAMMLIIQCRIFG